MGFRSQITVVAALAVVSACNDRGLGSAGDGGGAGDLGTVACGSSGAPCCVGSSGSCGNNLACALGTCLAPNAWAVGGSLQSSTGLHWDGSQWSTVVMPQDPMSQVNMAIWGSSATDVWAVGVNGVVVHYDGQHWTECGHGGLCSSSATVHPLFGVSGLSSSDVWAVGEHEAIHWDGAKWTSRAAGLETSTLRGVWCAASANCWAVENGGHAFHWNGAAWSSSGDLGMSLAYGIWGTSPSDVWLMGGTASDGRAAHWNGAAWSTSTIVTGSRAWLIGAWGSSSSDVWACGASGTVAHWDGTAWHQSSLVPPSAQKDLNGIWGFSARDVWTVGVEGRVFHWDGTMWSPVTSSTTDDLSSVWGPVAP